MTWRMLKAAARYARLGCLLGAAMLLGCEAVAGIGRREISAVANGAGGSGGSVASGTSGGSGAAGGQGGGAACPIADCACPVLFVSVENLVNETKPKPGHVKRFSLAGGAVKECAELTLPDELAQPFAMGWAHGRLVVADWTRVVALGPGGWAAAGIDGSLPRAIFPLRHGAERLVAVAYTPKGAEGKIDRVLTYDIDKASNVGEWTSTLAGLAFYTTGMSAHPTLADHFFACVRYGKYAVRDMAPFDNTYHDELMTAETLDTIDALGDRIVWTGGGAPKVHFGTMQTPVSLGYSCSAPACDQYLYAVVDPSDPKRALAICAHSGSLFHEVVRIDSSLGQSQPCLVVLDGSKVGAQTRLSWLATVP